MAGPMGGNTMDELKRAGSKALEALPFGQRTTSQLIRDFYDADQQIKGREQFKPGEIDYSKFLYQVDHICSFMVEKKGKEHKHDTGDSKDSWYSGGWASKISTLPKFVYKIPLWPNPQRIALDEPTQKNIIDLQYGAKIIERGGMIKKTLTISGNFGFFPQKILGGTSARIPTQGRGSGFFYYKLMFGLFRWYEAITSTKDDGHQYRLIFVDHVRQDAWYIEPTNLGSEQAVEQRYMNPYTWTFAVIAPYIAEVPKPGLWKKTSDYADKADEIMFELEESIGRIGQYVLDTERQIMAPFRSLADALSRIGRGMATAKVMFKKVIEEYNNFLKDVQTAIDSSKDKSGNPIDLGAANAIQHASDLCEDVLLEKIFFHKEKKENDYPSVFMDEPVIDPETGSVNTGEGGTGQRIATETVKPGDTVQIVAKRVFGTFDGWQELVALNKLKPPYIASAADIASDNLKGVIAEGEEIAYTTNGPFGTAEGYGKNIGDAPLPIINEKKYTLKNEQDEPRTAFDRALGVDILLKDGDVDFSQYGDFTKVVGIKNIKQQISTRFSLRKGSLRANEGLGISSHVGTSDPIGEFLIRQDMQANVAFDPRFRSIENLAVKKEGDLFYGAGKLMVKNLSIPIPVQVRRS